MPCVNIDKNRCKGCELCVRACPQQIIHMSTEINIKGYFYAEVFDQPRCIGCTLCGITCPDLAITVGANAVVYRFFDNPITLGVKS
jgi:2-oxoglutarate ferredoxin oxidoreductase subunit delta